MNVRCYTLLLTICMSLLPAVFAPVQAAIKCWTNDEGVRECGTSVPPEFSQKGHHEISKQGVIKDKVERAKTPEELEKEAEKERIALEIEKERQEKLRLDQVLLDTYIEVEDIELVRDDKIAAIKGNIKLANKQNEKIKKDLDRRTQSVENDKSAGRETSDKLLEDIESLKRQIATNEDHIDSQKQEIERTKQEYSDKIARFKELKKQ